MSSYASNPGLKTSLLFFFVILALIAAPGQAAADDTLPVSCLGIIGNTAEFIAAVQVANADPDHDTIVLGTECVYSFLNPFAAGSNALPVITEDLTIEGNNSDAFRSGIAPPMRLMEVADGVTVTLREMRIRDGLLNSGNGGGILAGEDSVLNLDQVDFLGNKAESGGGVYTFGDLMVAGGYFGDNMSTTASGGAIFARAGLTVEDAIFELNKSGATGGAIFTIEGGEIGTSSFNRNQAPTFGGGVNSIGPLTVNGGTFIENEAMANAGGGGAVRAEGTLDVNGSAFLYNESGKGGALFADDLLVEGSVFYYNHVNVPANGMGGAVYARSGSRGLTGNHFLENTSSHFGGGIYIAESAVISDSYFTNNSAPDNGVDIVIDHQGGGDQASRVDNNLLRSSGQSQNALPSLISLLNAVDSDGSVLVRHNTIVNVEGPPTFNQAAGDSSAAGTPRPQEEAAVTVTHTGVLIGAGEVTLENNIFTDLKVGLQDLSTDAVSRNNLYFNNEANEVGPAQPPTGQLVADPLFMGFDNYRLTANSPARNSGVNTDVTEDIRGVARNEGAPDRGAYEYDGEKERVFAVECGDSAGLIAAIEDANAHIGPDIVHILGGGVADCLFTLTQAAEPVGYYGPRGLPFVYDILIIDGAGATIRRAEEAPPFGLLESFGQPLVVQNVILENGRAEDDLGGAIVSVGVPNYEADLDMSSVRFINNYAKSSGGAVYVTESLAAYEIEAIGNESDGGGALRSETASLIEKSYFQGNKGGRGGAVGSLRDTRIFDSIFLNNEALEHGGAVHATGDFSFERNYLSGNSASDKGGGAYVGSAEGEAAIINNVWVKNSAVTGGAELDFNTQETDVTLFLAHNSFLGDGTQGAPPAVQLFSSSSTNVTFSAVNNIITGYETGLEHPGGSGATMNVDHHLYFGNVFNEAGSIDSSTNNILNQNPLFVNPPGGDLRLQPTSPARDAAANTTVQFDLQLVPRPQGPLKDIGAHEFTDNIPPLTYADYYRAVAGQPLVVTAPAGVLANDIDVDDTPLDAVLSFDTQYGQLNLGKDGGFAYTAGASFSGLDYFVYYAEDSQGAQTEEIATIVVTRLEEEQPLLIYLPTVRRQ